MHAWWCGKLSMHGAGRLPCVFPCPWPDEAQQACAGQRPRMLHLLRAQAGGWMRLSRHVLASSGACCIGCMPS